MFFPRPRLVESLQEHRLDCRQFAWMARNLELDLTGLFEAHWTNQIDFFAHVLESCVDWFSAAGASLFLKEDFDGRYHLTAQAGPASHVPESAVLIPGEGLAGAAIEEGKAKLVQDSGSRLGSAMLVPLSTPESGCIGILNVSRSDRYGKFSRAELTRADSVGRYVALAVNNARLMSRLNQAAAQSHALSEKLDAIISCLGVGVLVVNEHGEVTGWNPEATRILGDDLKSGCFVSELDASEALASAIHLVYVKALTGETNQSSAAEGGRAWSIIGSPLPSGGATIAIQDVSEQERTTQELARVKRLAEIGQMTAAVAHEIRNPLTGIRSAAQMVQTCEGEAVEFGRIIEEEALKLNELCDQFLEFARPLQLSRRLVDLGEMMKTIAQRHWQDFARAEVKLNLEIGEDSPKIEADPLRLEQVCRNLLLNALQACPPGQEVTVRTGENRFEVSDTGVGIEPSMREKLFTPFFTTKPSGTGLGLPNVRKIIDAHGWSVDVASDLSTGTTFTVSFRVAA